MHARRTVVLLSLVVGFTACGSDDDSTNDPGVSATPAPTASTAPDPTATSPATPTSTPSPTAGDWDWDCDVDHDLWERCEDGEIIWCHAVGTPHFHGGAKCELSGFECTDLEPGRAVCSVPGESCEDGTFDCDGNTARNCYGGVMGLEPCGTRRVCLADEEAGVATCWDDRPEAVCSGHGRLFEDGCVCFRGYDNGPDDTCVPAPEP